MYQKILGFDTYYSFVLIGQRYSKDTQFMGIFSVRYNETLPTIVGCGGIYEFNRSSNCPSFQ